MDHVTRRELGRMAAALVASQTLPAAASGQGSSAPSKYVGPLTGVTTGLDDRGFDPVVFARDLYANAPRRLRFQARARPDAEAWQRELRMKTTELLGGFPTSRSPLRPQVIETRTFPAYRREKVVFDSRAGVSVLAYVLTPSRGPTPGPAMICVPGHGRGVDDIVGIDDLGRDRTDRRATHTTSRFRSPKLGSRLSRSSRWDSDAGAIRRTRSAASRRKGASRLPEVR